jgi:hypothetical protein
MRRPLAIDARGCGECLRRGVAARVGPLGRRRAEDLRKVGRRPGARDERQHPEGLGRGGGRVVEGCMTTDQSCSANRGTRGGTRGFHGIRLVSLHVGRGERDEVLQSFSCLCTESAQFCLVGCFVEVGCVCVGISRGVDQRLPACYELNSEHRVEGDPAEPVGLGSSLEACRAVWIFALAVPAIQLASPVLGQRSGEVAVDSHPI